MALAEGSRARALGLAGGGSASSPGRVPEDPPLPGDDPNDLGDLCTPIDCGNFGLGQRGQIIQGPALVDGLN
jgi:hypothetical protein